ncbi:MAG: ACP S-malonyltransferase [Planctomycetes bacterium]|nr:ACP S-malonyltransferase [Planctomycetota bacterium]
MSKTALLFPGQGAQYVGMGKDLANAYPEAREVFDKADELLGFDLSRACFDGPEEELNRTDISQPAILTHSWAVVAALRTHEKGRELLDAAKVAAGLSLGEYSALAAAGAMSWEDAVKLVRARGRYMQEACDAKPGTMASIVGLDDDKLAEVMAPARDKGIVVLANFNAPGQVAISGEVSAVEEAMKLAKAGGAKLTVPLTVAGAFHSPLMAPAEARLAAEIETTRFHAPKIGVVANVDAEEHSDPMRLKANLVRQLTSPVKWASSMQKLVEWEYDTFIELGPGTVLAGLLKRVARSATRVSVGKVEELKSLLG